MVHIMPEAENISYIELQQKENYETLQKWILQYKNNFTLEDSVKSWCKQRQFQFRKERKTILVYDKEFGDYTKDFYLFCPLAEAEKHYQTMLDIGFYSRYFDFQINWAENDFYQTMFADFFIQYIINGANNYGYYIFGDVGVGKSTLMSVIAGILITFLNIKVSYITMPRLVRLITSINEAAKDKISVLENSDILFIDDFAHENYNTSNQEALVRVFFAYRYGNRLVNIIASNKDIRQLRGLNSFNRQMSDYMNDSKYYKILELSGKSRRI